MYPVFPHEGGWPVFAYRLWLIIDSTFMNKLSFYFFIALLSSLLFSGCSSKKQSLDNGIWRGVLVTDSAVEIPFNFEVYDSAGVKQFAFINAGERLNINEVSETEDSVYIITPLYESEIRAAKLSDGSGLSGHWIKRLPDREIIMDFSGKPDEKHRFLDNPKEPSSNLAGRWSTQFLRNERQDTTFAVGEFEQKGSTINGSFLTTTGDYRYLSGVVDKNTLMMSGFSGSGPMLFTAEIRDSMNIVNGKLYSGPSSVSDWYAKRDEDALLPDAYKIAGLKAGNDHIDFTFKDLEERDVSLSDERFKGKVVLVQFLGSWCPNCMDETAFLAPFYDKYKDQGFEVIGLAYERYDDTERARKAVQNLINRFDVRYPILLTGYKNDKKEVEKSIPALENFTAFPTTILIDKVGRVVNIHTGFNGPATGKHYTEYIEGFEREINHLLAQ